MRGKRFVVGAWAITVVWAAGGCFKPALEREVDGEDSSEVAETDDSAETSADSAPDTGSDTVETPDLVDTNDADMVATLDTPDTLEPDVAPSCSVDGECVGLAQPPCVVGRCVEQRCAAVNVSVPCDDGDVCTTADQCQAGVCAGRAFTADEAKNWFITIAGPGEDAAVAVAPHPSGDSLVTGGFTGSVQLTGATLDAEGAEADAFLLRVTPRGQLLRAVRIGTEDRDIGVSVSPAELVAQVVVGLNTLDVESGTVSSSVVWVNDNGTLRQTLPIPGRLMQLAADGNGLAFAVVEFSGSILLEMADGGQLSLSSTARNVVVIAIDSRGVQWAKKLASGGNISGQAVALDGDGLRVSLEASESVDFGGMALGAGGILLEMGLNGAYVAHTSLEASVFLPSTFLRDHRATTTLSFGNEGAGEFFPQAVITNQTTQSCEVALPYAPQAQSAAWGFGRAWTHGLMLHGLAAGVVELGGVELDFSSRPGGLLASYDKQCRLRAALPTPFPLLDNGPATLSFAARDLTFYMGDSAPNVLGGLVFATTVRDSKALGADFDDAFITPIGGADALVGGYSAARTLGCTTD